MSKRELLREHRQRSASRTRTIWIGLIAIIALGIVAAFAVPALTSVEAPVGAFATITPNPRPQANGTSMGNPNAAVKVEEFSDFQCPYCQMYSLQEEALTIEKYVKTGKIYFTYTSWAFIGPESEAAAKASLCASEQGKFWDYHDILFANQGKTENGGAFTDRRLAAFAQSIGLNTTTFNSCTSSNKYSDQINQNKAKAESMGINSTPTFSVNGTLVDMGKLDETIDAALASAK
jgi:protein-disulfide isomerase